MAAFAQFGSELDAATQAQLNRGEAMVEVLKQGQYEPLPVEKQVAIIFFGVNGYLDDIPIEAIGRLEKEYFQFLEAKHPDILNTLREKKEIDDQIDRKLREAIDEFKVQFKAELDLKEEPATEAAS
jgi:F-type H+-transporting ATPase subunit alpha